MNRKLLLVLPAVAATLLLSAQPASAHGFGRHPHRYRSRYGFRHRTHGYIGVQGMGMAIVGQATDYSQGGYIGQGGGGGLFGGVRINPFLSIEGNWMITWHDIAWDSGVVELDVLYLMSFTADAKIHLPTRSMIEPYFQAGLGFIFAGVSYGANTPTGDAIFAKAPIFNLGGGVDIWLGPWLTVGGRLLYRGMYFSEPSAGSVRYTNFVSALSFDINAQFHF